MEKEVHLGICNKIMNMTLITVCVLTSRRDSLRQIKIGILTVLGLALTITASHAVTFTTLKSFGILTNVTGCNPTSLVQGEDGAIYGTTSGGEGATIHGAVFKMQPDGSGFTALKLLTNYVEGFSPRAVTLSGNVLMEQHPKAVPATVELCSKSVRTEQATPS
jgi:hypothetical protein